MEEQLSGACTTEIAAFDEFAKLLGDRALAAAFDHVVFDTAPTGHTLRLLRLPAAWSGFLESNVGGTSCLGPLSGLQGQRKLYAATVRALADGAVTTVVLVARPERAALAEADRTRQELAALGVANQKFALNGLFKARDARDETARALEARGRSAIASMPEVLASLPRIEIPLLPLGLVGIDALRGMATLTVGENVTERDSSDGRDADGPPNGSLHGLISEFEAAGGGVIMTMGKGGVGKTALASAIAVELAGRGHRVHLTTTDPAAHLDATLASHVPGLTVSRIDPIAETTQYREEVMASVGKALDDRGRGLLEEDLRSPCTEEVAVFRAFAREVDRGRSGFVILDTAPTGHTLLLLDATEAYHRQVSHTMSDVPDSVRQLLPRLRDPRFTRILVVTLAEATPVHEAAQLQRDLARAGISPFAWIVNQSLVPLRLRDPVLASRRKEELRYIEEVRTEHASRVALIPWTSDSQDLLTWLRRLVDAGKDQRHPSACGPVTR
jgi:arsenite-transporting ATPase